MTEPDPREGYEGEDFEAEDNAPAATANEEDHENPWQYADLDGDDQPLEGAADIPPDPDDDTEVNS